MEPMSFLVTELLLVWNKNNYYSNQWQAAKITYVELKLVFLVSVLKMSLHLLQGIFCSIKFL